MFKKTLIAVTVTAAFFSFEAAANATTRANSAESAVTAASVGHRPVAAIKDGKNLIVSGKLVTGEKLTINKIFITDADGDTGDTSNSPDEASLTNTITKWYLVKDGAADVELTDSDNNHNTMTIPAEATGGKIKVVYTVTTATGTPSVAKDATEVTLTPTNSDVTSPGGSVDGTVSAQLSSVTIRVTNVTAPTPDINGDGVTADTPVVGATLEAILDCAADTSCDVAQYKFKWSMADANTTNFTEIKPSSTEVHKHIIQGNQQNKIFKVEVIPAGSSKADAPAAKVKRR